MEFDSKGDKIAVGLTALSVAVIVLNLGLIFGGGNSPLQGLFESGDNTQEQPVRDTPEENQTQSYYDKAAQSSEDTDSSSDSSEDSGGENLNITEKTKLEEDFSQYVNNSERDNGIYLDRKAIVGETNSIWVYSNGDPVQGAEVLINGQSIGTTSRFGDVLFTVPDTEKLTVRTNTEELGSVEDVYEVYQ